MKLYLPRKGQAFLVGVVLLLNIICFLTLGRATVSRTGMGRLARQVLMLDNFNDTSVRTNASHASTTATTVSISPDSPRMKMKIDAIRRYLNESAVNSELLPAMKIGRYIMVDPNRCNKVNMVDVVILVHTAPNNFAKRQRMRDSFAKESLFLPFHVRIAFLLGRPANSTIQRMLWLEHVTYNDTVMGDFLDSYHNLTLKGVMGYRWVLDFCSNSKYVLKIDDDVLVNMYKLLYSFSGHMNGKKKSIFCNVWKRSTMGILRTGKWKVDSNVFRNMTRFPYDYCSGFLVILTSDLMKPLYEAAKITPFFWIDDIYLFGMLPKVVGGVTYYNYALNSNTTLDSKRAIECTNKQGPRCPIFATIIADQAFLPYWKTINDLYSSPSSWKVEQTLVE